MDLVVGQEVIGKFRTSDGKGTRAIFMFPHGHVTEITSKGFKVKFAAIKGEWYYSNEDIGKIVYLKEHDMGKEEEQLDYEIEKGRLGIED
ncbi:MAG: hypothetical protein IJF07_06135 [Lachnospiraceae bacterium]|nr:hypothetical protein [Lachnospiraceae bacterium]